MLDNLNISLSSLEIETQENSYIQNTLEYYETSANEYFNKTKNIKLIDLWSKVSSLNINGPLIDLGCGSCRDIHYFNSQGIPSYGVDLSINLLNLAKAEFNEPVVNGDISRLPFKSETFGLALGIGSLIHVPRIYISRVLLEVNRVVRRNSYFVASIKKGDTEKIDQLGRFFVYYNNDEWCDLLKNSNFDIIEVQENIEIRKDETITWLVTIAKKQA